MHGQGGSKVSVVLFTGVCDWEGVCAWVGGWGVWGLT